MRSVPAAELLQAIVDVLESRVTPVISDPAGLRALWISIGLLDNLVVRIDDKTAIAEHERGLLVALLAPLHDGVSLPVGDSSSLTDLHQALAARLRTMPWLREPGNESGPSRAWLDQCRAALTAINSAQISLLRSTRYGLANAVERGA